VHVARRDGRLVGALPLCTFRRRGLRVIQFVGGPTSALADVLLAPGEGPATAAALTEQAARSPHDVADVFGLPVDSRFAAALGAKLRVVERVEAPVLDLSDGWETIYRTKTDSKKRNQHNRRRRQLAELGGVEIVRARARDELEPALEEAFRLHDLRWAGRPDGSDFTGDRGKPFNRAALCAFAAEDAARIVLLTVGGRAIAFHYYLVFCKRMFVYRLAFDPAYSRYSPGLVNTLDALAWAGEENLERVEYLGGGERYKLELSDELQPLYQGLGLAASPQGHVYLAARLGSIRLRRRLKRSPTLHRLYFDTLAPARRRLVALRSRGRSDVAESASS
jgi:CelD/BcsL family acetyltransferase involved in cellulose biosynthesis